MGKLPSKPPAHRPQFFTGHGLLPPLPDGIWACPICLCTFRPLLQPENCRCGFHWNAKRLTFPHYARFYTDAELVKRRYILARRQTHKLTQSSQDET